MQLLKYGFNDVYNSLGYLKMNLMWIKATKKLSHKINLYTIF